MPTQLSLDEINLRSELIVQIALRLVDLCLVPDIPANDRFCRTQAGIKGTIINHWGISDFEHACGVLNRAGATRALNADLTPKADARSWAGLFENLFDIPELRRHLSEAQELPSLPDTIEAFIAIMTDYGIGSAPVSTTRGEFPIPEGLRPAFDHLRRCGYVGFAGHHAKWTEKIAPAMRANYAWSDD